MEEHPEINLMSRMTEPSSKLWKHKTHTLVPASGTRYTLEDQIERVKWCDWEGLWGSKDSRGKISVKDEEKVLAFTVDDKTKITKGREVLSFTDLRKGMQIRLKYRMDGDKKMAVTIKVAAAEVWGR